MQNSRANVPALDMDWTNRTKCCWLGAMKPVKMHEAKTNFSKLIGLVEAGEEVVIQRGDVPVAKIVPYEAGGHAREAGALKGRIEIAEDFDSLPAGFEEYVG